MTQVFEWIKSFIAAISPAAILVFSILGAWSIIKWVGTLGEALKAIGEKPSRIILVICIAAAMFYFYYKFVARYL